MEKIEKITILTVVNYLNMWCFYIGQNESDYSATEGLQSVTKYICGGIFIGSTLDIQQMKNVHAEKYIVRG